MKKTWLLNWRSIERKELYEMDSFTGHTRVEKRKYFQINALLVVLLLVETQPKSWRLQTKGLLQPFSSFVVLFSLPESKFDCHCQKLKQEKNLLTFLLSKKKRAKREQKEGRHTNRVDKWFQKYCRPVTTDKRNKINCPILGPPAGLLFG